MDYTVSYGDSLWNIVTNRYNCNSNAEILELVNEIAENNSLENGGNSIFENQQLILPENEFLKEVSDIPGDSFEIADVTEDYENASEDINTENQINNNSSLPGKYELNGKEYNCITDEATMNNIVYLAAQGGAGTKYNHEDKCLSIAQTYGLWATGDSDRNYNDPGVWEYGDATAYTFYNNDSKEAVLAEVKKELDAGRPCILHVNGTSDYSRHYVAVVGYNSEAGDTLQESDLLLWDSYDSSLCDCGPGGDRHMITGYATGRTGDEGYGWQIFERRAA